jgi:hypothetical protein
MARLPSQYCGWFNVKDRYLGFKFQIGGKTHYGWARLNARLQGSKITLVLTGYAYETIPGKAIIAGQTKGSENAGGAESIATPTASTDESATLGALAMGAPGLSIWRRKESVVAIQ